jgi:hypothetical protein
VNQPDERQPVVRRRVADRRVAARRVPAHQTIGCQPHAGKVFHAAGQAHMLRRGLYDVGASVAIEDPLGSAEKVRERLTVLAVANAAIAGGRHIDFAAESSAVAREPMHDMAHGQTV